MGDETDIFFAELQAPAAGPREQPATAPGDGDDDGWFERAASDALAGNGAASPCGEAIGAAALAPDRELVARTTRRHRRPRAASSPAPGRRGARRGLGRLGAVAAGCVLLVLTLALVTNHPSSSSPDARPNRSAGDRTVTPPRASWSTPARPPRAPAAAAARDRFRPAPRRSQRTQARTPKRTVRDRARRRPARRVSSPTPRVSPATPPADAPRPPPPPAAAAAAAARPAVRRPHPAVASFVPGDLPPAR